MSIAIKQDYQGAISGLAKYNRWVFRGLIRGFVECRAVAAVLILFFCLSLGFARIRCAEGAVFFVRNIVIIFYAVFR